MSESGAPVPRSSRALYPYGQESSSNLADILERVLDKGIVIVGDIKINLLDIELLTIKLRLLVASVDKAREIGIDWWERDPALSSRADGRHSLQEQNQRLRDEVEELRRQLAESPRELSGSRSSGPRGSRDAERVRRETRESHAEPRRKPRKVRNVEDTGGNEDRS